MTASDAPPDVVVVGSGPSGAIAASELVRLGLRVTMLDAGPAAPRGVLLRVRGNTVFRWVHGGMETDRHVAVDDPGTQWFSSRSLGGLSNYWTAAVPRMHPLDFTEGAALDERYRWPITYDDLEPYYALVERGMQVTAGTDELRGAPANVRTFARTAPRDWRELAAAVGPHGHSVGVLPMANGRPTALVRRPTGWNSYHRLVRPLLTDPRFTLRRGAQVVRLDWSGRDGAVRAVEYFDRGSGERRSLACRAVVVAAGTLDSTRILLQSRSEDFPDGLGNTEGLVGRYLHDHPRQWWPARLDRRMSLLSHPQYVTRRPHGEEAPLMSSSLTLGMVGQLTRVKAWYGGTDDQVGVQVFGTMVPTEAFTATLPRRSDLDADLEAELREPLRIGIHYDAQAVANMAAARERFTEVFAAAGIRAMPQGPFHDLVPGSSVHYAGTVRMHDDRRYGVLDGWNRIYDVPNVVVSDLSCFTTGSEKNPTLTAMAIAARAAHRLAEDLGRGPGGA